MIENIVPGFDDIDRDIMAISTSGYLFALNVRIFTPEFFHTTYPQAWVETYTRNKLALIDPVLLWANLNEGARRWSEVRYNPGKRLVAWLFREAISHGLVYGAIISVRNPNHDNTKSILSVSRADREFTDDEISFLKDLFEDLVKSVSKHGGLALTEVAVLSRLAMGLTQDEIAVELGLSRETIKQRTNKARRVLRAKNASHAVAIAVARGLVKLPRSSLYN